MFEDKEKAEQMISDLEEAEGKHKENVQEQDD